MSSMNHWMSNGDLVVEEHTRFRPIGWLINGGPNDGNVVRNITQAEKDVPHGSFTPIYIQIED